MKRAPAAKPAVKAAPATGWLWLAALAAVLAAFGVYAPALDGPFVLDDLYLAFGRPDAAKLGLPAWIAGRPLLGLTYYANYQASGTAPGSYHMVNLLLHLAAAALVFVCLRYALRAVESREDWIAVAGAGVFLLHPLQTEAVAYIAGRSDVLCTVFAYAAIAVFLRYRRPSIGFGAVAAVLLLALLALLSKQQAVAIPAVLILIDLLWHEGSPLESVKKNIRLHGLLLAGALAGAAWVFTVLGRDTTAGLRVEGLGPLDYFLTQCRAIWRYIFLLILPAGQNLDTDFAISRGLFDRGSAFGLAGLAALAGGAVWLRRSWPLAAAGVLIFLALLAPTSSFIPIKDPVAERRVYFAMLGPLLILADVLRRLSAPLTTRAGAMAVALALLGAATCSRAQLWGDEMALWKDTVAKSPQKMRPRFQLAHLYYRAQQCPAAAREYEIASKLEKPTVALLVDWGLALDCAGRAAEAIDVLKRSVATERTYNSLAQAGMVLAKQGRFDEALPLLNEAIAANAAEPSAFGYRGNVLATQGKLLEAAEDFKRALALDPADPAASRGLQYVQQRLAAPR